MALSVKLELEIFQKAYKWPEVRFLNLCHDYLDFRAANNVLGAEQGLDLLH